MANSDEKSQEQTKKCPKCQEDILTGAKRCKHCQADLRNWFARHVVLTVITGLIVLIIIISASSGNKDEMKAGTGGVDNKSQAQFIAKNMGDEVLTKTYKFKINSADERASISGGYSNPKPATEGAKFIVINMDVTNVTNDNATFFPNESLTLVDNQGKKFKTYENTIGNIDNYLEVADLSPSIVKKGVLVYEVPKETLVYDLFIENIGTKDIYQVKIK